MNEHDIDKWLSINSVEALERLSLLMFARLQEYESILGFYAKREHWMALSEDTDSLRTSLVAMTGDGEQHGFSFAERVLKKYEVK